MQIIQMNIRIKDLANLFQVRWDCRCVMVLHLYKNWLDWYFFIALKQDKNIYLKFTADKLGKLVVLFFIQLEQLIIHNKFLIINYSYPF